MGVENGSQPGAEVVDRGEYYDWWHNKPDGEVLEEHTKQVGYMRQEIDGWENAKTTNPFPGVEKIEEMHRGTMCNITDLEKILRSRGVEFEPYK